MRFILIIGWFGLQVLLYSVGDAQKSLEVATFFYGLNWLIIPVCIVISLLAIDDIIDEVISKNRFTFVVFWLLQVAVQGYLFYQI